MPPWILVIVSLFFLASTETSPEKSCFPLDGRQEVRLLSAEQRGRVAAAFRNARRLLPNWKPGQTNHGFCLLVRSLDSALKPSLFPFWDSRIEERMSNPRDSPLFMGRFFPDKSMRKRRKTRDRRVRSEFSSVPMMSTSLVVALRTGRHAQLLAFLHTVGTDMRASINDSCSSLCPQPSDFATCSRDWCFSRIRPGGVCHENSVSSPCYNSLCVNGVCSVPTRRRPQNSSEYSRIGDETLAIVQLPDMKTKTIKDDIEGSGEETQRASNVYYSVEATQQTTLAPASTVNKTAFDFNSKMPFPTVYFPITIIKRRHSRRFVDAEPISVSSMGRNLPSGYTQTIMGEYANVTRGLVRVLDPRQATIAIEAQIIVTQGGTPCEALRNIGDGKYTKGSNTIRLSKYKKISDPVLWFTNPTDIPWKWTGSGYYKKPVADYLLFKC